LSLDTLPGVGLSAEAAIDWGSATGRMFQVLSTELGSTGYTAGMRARYGLYSRLDASARVAIGTVRESLKIRDSAGESASDHGWSELVTGAIGLEVRAIESPRLSLGMRLELGYVAAAPVALVAHSDTSSPGTLMLQMQDAPLGRLNLSGPSLGFTVFSQF